MVKKIVIIIISVIIGQLILYGKDNKIKLPYNFLPSVKIATMNLKALISHRAEVLGSRGYTFKNTFLNKEMLKRPWYKKQDKPLNNFSIKEKKYISRLTKQIKQIKKLLLIKRRIQLKRLLKNSMIIKFDLLADLNANGYHEYIAICSTKFNNISKKKLRQSEGYQTYYTRSNKLYLMVLLKNNNKTILSHIKISKMPFGIAEYISDFQTGYYLDNGMEQIKIIVHTFQLKNQVNKKHFQFMYLFSLNKKRLANIFSYPIYSSHIKGDQEKIIEYNVKFKNIEGRKQNEIILSKQITKRNYNYNISPQKPNYQTKVYKGKQIYFVYDKFINAYKKK